MNLLFYISAIAAVIATTMVIAGKNAVHALLYLIVSFLSVSVMFFLLGAPFIAALEVIIYAGAIMVLFVFVIMMLNVGVPGKGSELLKTRAWIGPSLIALVLLCEMIFIVTRHSSGPLLSSEIAPDQVGKLLFTRYILIVELSAFLLASGIIGAFHLAEKETTSHHRYLRKENQPS